MLVGVLFHGDDFFDKNDKVQNGSIMHDNKLQNGNRITKIAQGRTYHNDFINYTCLCFIITFSRTTLTSQELLSMYIYT